MIIGIPVSTSKKQYFINQAYVNYVAEAGMEPLLFTQNNNINLIANVCDGLLLPGGIDVEPTFYGENNLASYSVDPAKDVFERKALFAFVEAGKYVFGICRGFQLIIREYLKAHLEEEVWIRFWQNITDHTINKEMDIPRDVPSHIVEYTNDIYGGNKKVSSNMYVNSMHHQGVVVQSKKRPENSSIRIIASTKIGMKKKEFGHIMEGFTIEGTNSGAKISAVQWHPEELRDYKLIQTFFGVKPEGAANEGKYKNMEN